MRREPFEDTVVSAQKWTCPGSVDSLPFGFSVLLLGGLGGNAPQLQGPTVTRSAPRLSVISGGLRMALELGRAQIAERRVPPVEVVPALEELEDRHAGLALSSEPPAIE